MQTHPHLRIGVLNVLAHPQERRLGLIFPVLHIPELLQVCLNILLGVLASVSRSVVLPSALQLEVCVAAMADVGFFELDELFGVLIELLEMVARVCNPSRFET
jgi:hypothetical protein